MRRYDLIDQPGKAGNFYYSGNDDARNGNLDSRILEKFVTQVYAVPERDHVTLNGHVVLTMKPKMK